MCDCLHLKFILDAEPGQFRRFWWKTSWGTSAARIDSKTGSLRMSSFSLLTQRKSTDRQMVNQGRKWDSEETACSRKSSASKPRD